MSCPSHHQRISIDISIDGSIWHVPIGHMSDIVFCCWQAMKMFRHKTQSINTGSHNYKQILIKQTNKHLLQSTSEYESQWNKIIHTQQKKPYNHIFLTMMIWQWPNFYFILSSFNIDVQQPKSNKPTECSVNKTKKPSILATEIISSNIIGLKKKKFCSVYSLYISFNSDGKMRFFSFYIDISMAIPFFLKFLISFLLLLLLLKQWHLKFRLNNQWWLNVYVCCCFSKATSKTLRNSVM